VNKPIEVVDMTDLDMCYDDGFQDAVSGRDAHSADYDRGEGRDQYRRGYVDGVEARLASRGVTMWTKKQEHERTRLFRAWIMWVYCRDDAYWLIPNEPNVVGGVIERDTLDYAPRPLIPIVLTLRGVKGNAERVGDDEARDVIKFLNERYGMRILYAGDKPEKSL